MNKNLFKYTFLYLFIILISTCIDPYTPRLKGYECMLVVEGRITDEDNSSTVRLSRTLQDQDIMPQMIEDAQVYVTDENSSIIDFKYSGNGRYKTDSLRFRAAAGNKYVLHINLPNGQKYESDECSLEPVSDIDSIYYIREQYMINNKTEIADGIRIYIDSKTGENQYFRWDFEEVWKYKIPVPRKCNFINSANIVAIPDFKEYCWKRRNSNAILIKNSDQNFRKQAICFIPSSKSERLMNGYSILVKQYSISQKEFEFWNKLNVINDDAGDIFSAQPYSIFGNMHNLNNPDDQVLGYFSVSAVSAKRIFIPFRITVKLGLPFYNQSQCNRIEKAPEDFATPYGAPVSFEELYRMFCINSDYIFCEPVYNGSKLEKLVFARPECTQCEINSIEKPEFWDDFVWN